MKKTSEQVRKELNSLNELRALVSDYYRRAILVQMQILEEYLETRNINALTKNYKPEWPEYVIKYVQDAINWLNGDYDDTGDLSDDWVDRIEFTDGIGTDEILSVTEDKRKGK